MINVMTLLAAVLGGDGWFKDSALKRDGKIHHGYGRGLKKSLVSVRNQAFGLCMCTVTAPICGRGCIAH
jgi:hypothetical protein